MVENKIGYLKYGKKESENVKIRDNKKRIAELTEKIKWNKSSD